MDLEDKVLRLLKEKPLLVMDLRTKLMLPDEKTASVLAFLKKQGLIDTEPSTNEMMMAKITERGLHLLNLPNLPEGETTGEEITELMLIDQKMGDKTINLYSLSQLTETANWIDNMAMRFNVRPEDVTRALWLDGKTTVWAKLEQDMREKKRQK